MTRRQTLTLEDVCGLELTSNEERDRHPVAVVVAGLRAAADMLAELPPSSTCRIDQQWDSPTTLEVYVGG